MIRQGWAHLSAINIILRENNLSHPAKGGSTPAFASQLAAIAPETLYLITTF